MPRGRGRPGGTVLSLEGGRGHPGDPQAAVPRRRPPRRVPQGRPCPAALSLVRVPPALPPSAGGRPGTGGACAPHPPFVPSLLGVRRRGSGAPGVVTKGRRALREPWESSRRRDDLQQPGKSYQFRY